MISAVVITYNEEKRIKSCLDALKGIEDVWVVDSSSKDRTVEIAKSCGAQVQDYKWNGKYPKKKQWCLDQIPFRYDWVLMLDADEICTTGLLEEIHQLDLSVSNVAGYFIKGRYKSFGKVLRFGFQNNKCQLVHREKMEFPVIDDLDMYGMGEVEGHYQPVLKKGYAGAELRQLKNYLIHDAYDDVLAWEIRHKRYAHWERAMNKRNSWPKDPDPKRQHLKQLFRKAPYRGLIAFCYAYIWKLGFLEGRAGFIQANRRRWYYRMIETRSAQGA